MMRHCYSSRGEVTAVRVWVKTDFKVGFHPTKTKWKKFHILSSLKNRMEMKLNLKEKRSFSNNKGKTRTFTQETLLNSTSRTNPYWLYFYVFKINT
jgi:hypothetical protein